MLVDFVYYVCQYLFFSDFFFVVQFFVKNIDDEFLFSSIQIMFCKFLLNLVDCICFKSEQESGNGRDVLMWMLEVFVFKFYIIVWYQFFVIFKKCKFQLEFGVVEVVLFGVFIVFVVFGFVFFLVFVFVLVLFLFFFLFVIFVILVFVFFFEK